MLSNRWHYGMWGELGRFVSVLLVLLLADSKGVTFRKLMYCEWWKEREEEVEEKRNRRTIHAEENAGKAEPRQRSWATPEDVIPSRPLKFVEKRVGRRNDGDGLPATKGVSDVSPLVILPCGWLRLSTNTGFSVPVPARCEREDRPERNPCPGIPG
ncbi:hypothetical protein G5714_011723 [Onychostoma macrolepis]|uniref:Uncharacterized protein n=1 Tax=Onychostoma macrolepis TaxID=369639 RepID=A0A7J6CJ68_9TELE|nr:hypothetical protein G5714_011723 [Onychostoma macrolepis]